MSNQLTLLYFDDKEDLLSGIAILQQYDIPIREVHTQSSIPGLETKLRIKQIRLGYAVLRFGCLGSAALVMLVYDLLQHGGFVLVDALTLLLTFFISIRLFPGNVPRLFILKPGDRRCLVVVDAKNTPVNESVTQLFRYAGAVDLSLTLKNSMIS